ncbi:leucine-rich repeat neuronal protein 2 [Spea bombifrons]|uniref:leucine-rich repeat neuronal protein 2 n=1 Tax=Spea bombifrons TaxID=233779 RepID=UPI002349A585|nr:leucine-rich repeat neuronal protein 2 [Spea bombifrons]
MGLLGLELVLLWHLFASSALAGIPAVPWRVACPSQCVCQIRPWYTPRSAYREANTVDCNDLFVSKVPRGLPAGTHTLLLQSNNIAYLEQQDLSYLENLTELDLSQNSFCSVHDFNARYLPSLVSLHLEENQLTQLPDHSFSGLESLEELYLNHNQLSIISPKAFYGLQRLLRLHLNSNLLRSLDNRWFRELPALEVLMVGGNKVSSIPDMNFQPLSNLRSLVLAGMGLKEISDYSLEGLVNLESLSFYDNKLVKVPKRALQRVPGLKFLDLNKNPLSRIQQKDFADMAQLKELGLNSMEELVSIDELALINLPELTKLEVTNNPKLSFIHPRAFQRLPRMETLMLNNNALSSLHRETVESLPNLQEIAMHGNPLRCDCVIRWVNTTAPHVRFMEPQSTLCVEPPELRRTQLRLVPFREMSDHCLPLIPVSTFAPRIRATSGQSITLHCRALAEPEPQIFWVTPSGERLGVSAECGGYRVQQEGTLEIQGVSSAHAGLYTCVAQNLVGADYKSVHLMVNQLYPARDGPVQLRVGEIGERHLLLSWNPPLNTLGCSLRWSCLTPGASVERARLPVGLHSYNVTRLLPGEECRVCLRVSVLGGQVRTACASARTRETATSFRHRGQKALTALVFCFLLTMIGLLARYRPGGRSTSLSPWPLSGRVIYPPVIHQWDQNKKEECLLSINAPATSLC